MTVSQKYIFVEAIQLTWSLVSKIRIGSHEHSFSFLLNLGGDMGLQNHRGFKGTTQQNTFPSCAHHPMQSVSFHPHCPPLCLSPLTPQPPFPVAIITLFSVSIQLCPLLAMERGSLYHETHNYVHAV